MLNSRDHTPTMTELPPLMRDQRKIDAGHLKLIGIFHLVLAGLSVFGLGFLFLHWLFLHSFIDNPAMWKNQANQPPPPKEIFAIFKWFYFAAGGCMILAGIANLVSGWLILKRRARIYSLVVAGLDCLCFPFGTVLGVFTFVVLLRESVVEVYDARLNPPA
jgi:hypothetical protein